MHNTQKKGPNAICGQRSRSRLACASVQYNLCIFSSSTYTIVSTDSVCGQQRPRSACAYAQADQGCIVRKLLKGPFMRCTSVDIFLTPHWNFILLHSWIRSTCRYVTVFLTLKELITTTADDSFYFLFFFNFFLIYFYLFIYLFYFFFFFVFFRDLAEN